MAAGSSPASFPIFDRLSIAMAQLNPTVGAIAHNCDLIRRSVDEASAKGADLIVFSEFIVCGYPPEDLVYRPRFLDEVEAAVHALAKDIASTGCAALISAPWRQDGLLYNAALLLDGGTVADIRFKVDLPNYSVFDEKRVFTAGPLPAPILFKGIKLGVMSCEDMWNADVSAHLSEQGADVFIVLNASPYEQGKLATRIALAQQRVERHGVPLVYVNQCGGQDEVVFDGRSFVMGVDGTLRQILPAFDETVASVAVSDRPVADDGDGLEMLYRALVTGLRDYVQKNGFPGVLLGLSGGVDSAISAVIAADALGADKVQCVMMPSRYTSQESLDDAALLADNLGVPYESIAVTDIVNAYHAALPSEAPSIMFENLQSRSRGVILMGLSNANGKMVLSTGNKSEMAVGYATIYGDMCGGYNALKDVYKTQVYALCEWRNAQQDQDIIPVNIITKAPTAELRDNQTDQDSLPPYEELDRTLYGLIEEQKSPQRVAEETGYALDNVRRVERLLARAEYKRRQAPPGVKVTARAFGKERRYPITNGFVEK